MARHCDESGRVEAAPLTVPVPRRRPRRARKENTSLYRYIIYNIIIHYITSYYVCNSTCFSVLSVCAFFWLLFLFFYVECALSPCDLNLLLDISCPNVASPQQISTLISCCKKCTTYHKHVSLLDISWSACACWACMSTSHFSLPIVFQIIPNTFLHKLHSCRNVCRHGAGDTLRLGRLSLGMSRYVLLSQWQVLAKRPWFQMERLLEITPQSVLESPKLINDTRTTRERHTKTRHVGHVGLYKRQDTTKPLWWIHAVLSLFHVGSKHIKTCQNIRSCLDVWRSSARHGQTERQWWWRCNFRLQKRIWNSVKQCKAM